MDIKWQLLHPDLKKAERLVSKMTFSFFMTLRFFMNRVGR